MSSHPTARKISIVFLCLSAGISFAREVPNVDPYVDGTDAVSMDALSRTEQKLGYFGDVDDLRRKLRECVSIDMGNGVILGGSGCEPLPDGSGDTGTGGTYSRLQEIVQGTECGQNHAWEVFAEHVGGTNAEAGKVNCSSLAASYCSALNKGKAASNLEAYYTCTKNGVLVSCLDIAKEYCSVLHPEEETSSESSGGTTDENVSPAVVGDLTEKEADKIVGEAKTNRCTVNGVEIPCSILSEANAIRNRLGNSSNFNQSTSECSADINCKDVNGAIVSCVTARDVIQCSKSSEEAPSLGYSCKVSDEEVDCSILGEGRCTQEVCARMCPDYGGKVIDNACYCNPEPMCSGVNQTGLNQCPLGGVAAKNGTMACYCFSEALCTGSEQYYYDDGDRVLLHKGDRSFCNYGGVCAGQQNNPLYECAVEICPYGSNLVKDGKKVFDGNLCPYGYEDDPIVVNRNCADPTICTYGGVNREDGSCACNEAPVCTGEFSTQTGANKCVYGGTPAANGTKSCRCNPETDCVGTAQSGANYCTYGGSSTADGTNGCACNEKPSCTDVCIGGGTPKGDGTEDCACSSAKNCDSPKVCAYGGTANGSDCTCNEAPICQGANQNGTNFCAMGGKPAKDGTQGCECNTAISCEKCGEVGGTPKNDGTNECNCNDGATAVITVSSYSHVSGIVTYLLYGYADGLAGALDVISGPSPRSLVTVNISTGTPYTTAGSYTSINGAQNAEQGLNATITRLDTGASVTTGCVSDTDCGKAMATLFTVGDVGKKIRIRIEKH